MNNKTAFIMDIENDVITFEAACEYLGISKGQMYNYTHQKAFPYYRPKGRRIYFRKSELTAFLTSNRIAPLSETNEAAHRIVRKSRAV